MLLSTLPQNMYYYYVLEMDLLHSLCSVPVYTSDYTTALSLTLNTTYSVLPLPVTPDYLSVQVSTSSRVPHSLCEYRL